MMTFFAVLLALSTGVLVSTTGQPLGVTDPTVISSTLQTVKDQENEIAQVGDFWTSLVVDFLQEGVAQAAQECQEKLGDNCTSEVLKQISNCINSSSVTGEVSKALNKFVSPLLSELKAIEKDLTDPTPDKAVIDKDSWTMNLTRTDVDSFVYRKNKAQSEFIVDVNPIADAIPEIATKCFTSQQV